MVVKKVEVWPKIGCGCILLSPKQPGKALYGLRKGSHGAGKWALPGGKLDLDEDALELCIQREIEEEVGDTPKFKKVIPLEMFTSNDQKFFFHTYLVAVDGEFIPKLNGEHSGYCWTAFECWPKNLHMGLKNTLNNKSIKGKLQTILDLIV